MKFNKETYLEALGELRKATNAADQAHSMLLDLKCVELGDTQDPALCYRGSYVTIPFLVNRLSATVKALESAHCDECGTLMIHHGEQCGESCGLAEKAQVAHA